MKLFKKLAGACLALTFCFGMVGLVACGGGNGDGDNGGNGGQANAYNFMVYTADQQPASDYFVQMCTVADDPAAAVCYQPVAIGEDGKVSLTQNAASCPAQGVYEVHILDNTYTPVATTETVYTPANFSAEYIVITLA